MALVSSETARAEPAAILTVPAGFDMAVWLPHEPADQVSAGRLPILLLSHGGGPGGGSPLILGGLAEAIAHEGFIVAAPFHGNAFALAAALPDQPTLDRVPGGHFVFAGPCTPAQQAAAPDVCPASDADRAATRERVARRIVEFLRKTL